MNVGYINYWFSARFIALPLSTPVRLRVQPYYFSFLFLMTQFHFIIAFSNNYKTTMILYLCDLSKE